ncbi:glutathione S-transferase D2 isoform X2 [Drosophila ananassae]|nr:glutathione S-transferase D2 isoform X2 [Drosophila ananassae]
MTPEFLKINPQHTIPTLVDNGFSVWESRAIAIYLVEKYGKDDSLYPKDPQKQAVVNQRLYFDLGSLADSFSKYYYPIILTGKPGSDDDLKRIETTFGFLNTFLEGQDYVAGDHLTVADFAILSSVSTFDIVEFDISKYPNVNRWYQNAKKVTPGWDESWESLLELSVKTRIPSNMDFYYYSAVAACRAVIMVAETLGIKLNKKVVNTLKGEQMNPDFIKVNPQHIIPTIVDDGFVLWESRAITAYLVEKYGKDDSLYPKDPQKRAVVNQRLYFDMGIYNAMFKYYFIAFSTGKYGSEEDFKGLENVFGFLNTFLEGHDYVAGDKLTIADISILASVSTLVAMGFELTKFPNVDKWYNNAKNVVPGFAENWEGAQLVAENVVARLK